MQNEFCLRKVYLCHKIWSRAIESILIDVIYSLSSFDNSVAYDAPPKRCMHSIKVILLRYSDFIDC